MQNSDEILTAEEDISSDLRKVLNANGFSFQYAVARRITEFSKKNYSRLKLEGTEIPVGPERENTHIDLVIESIGEFQNDDTRFYLIGECKRVDPAKGRWCFTRSPYTWPYAPETQNTVQFDRLYEVDADVGRYKADTAIAVLPSEPYSLGFELKTNRKGNGLGSADKSAIAAAVTQVSRGTKGFIHLLNGYDASSRSAKLTKLAFFVPVVFTTAELFTTTVDISSANIKDGNLDCDDLGMTQVDWLWFNHNRSLGLSHDVQVGRREQSNYNRHYLDFTRSLAIVGPNGIDDFLRTDFYRLLPHRS